LRWRSWPPHAIPRPAATPIRHPSQLADPAVLEGIFQKERRGAKNQQHRNPTHPLLADDRFQALDSGRRGRGGRECGGCRGFGHRRRPGGHWWGFHYRSFHYRSFHYRSFHYRSFHYRSFHYRSFHGGRRDRFLLPHQSEKGGFHTGQAEFERADPVGADKRHDRQHNAQAKQQRHDQDQSFHTGSAPS
jgi:hypothetical protein